MKNFVVFCDDNDTDPFWEESGRRRAGFSDEDWGADWKIEPFACPGDSDCSWTDRFCHAISGICSAAKVYVVTDANFGGDANGGATLLKKLLEDDLLARGVVFSTALPRDDAFEYACTCAIKDDRTEEVAARIRHFLESGQRPAPDPETQIQSLSRSIHQLENLALPLRYDIESLDTQEMAAGAIEAIWDDYFGSPAEGVGFLLASRAFSEGISGIENEIVRILDSVRSVPNATETAKNALDAEEDLTSEAVKEKLGIGAARGNPGSLKGNLDDLQRTLTEVRDKILALASELRKLRDHLETNEGGRQS